jgi:DUF4097 and DUF4098 domain-containing protein YvlB
MDHSPLISEEFMNRNYFYTALLMVFLVGLNVFAQDDSEKEYRFCSSDNWSNGDRVSANDLRELNLPAGGVVKVDSENGRITVTGENRSDVLVRACVRTWGETEAEAKTLAGGIRIDTSNGIRAVNTPSDNWSVSYELRVPRTSNLDLNTNNGRITIESVQGQMNFRTNNGRITLENVAGDIRGRTNNGRVTVSLAGPTFQGNGLDVETGNGRITLNMPRTFAANVEVGTTNGRFSSDFEELQLAAELDSKEKRRSGPKRVTASVNGGGAPIRLITTNGRVSINSSSDAAQ